MSELKCEGLVIRSIKTGSGDKLITILTEQHGKIGFYARSPQVYPVSLLTYCQFVLSRTRNALYLSQVSIIESFYNLHRDMLQLTYALYFCEVAMHLTQEMESSGKKLSLLLNTLHYLSQGKASSELLKPLFQLRILSLAGFMPAVNCCAECSSQQELTGFSPSNGGAICVNCQKKGVSFYNLDQNTLTALKLLLQPSLKGAFSLNIDHETLDKVDRLTEMFLSAQINCKMNTLTCLKAIKKEMQGYKRT